MCSRVVSTMKSAPGKRLMSEIEPKFFSNLARKRSTCNFSFLESELKVPSCFMRSIAAIFLTALRMVTKLVNIPPGQRSVMYGMFALLALSATMSFACFLVATKRILRPLAAIFLSASLASSIFAAVLYRLIMWIPLRSIYMYGAMFGFHLRVRCPKCTPASSNSFTSIVFAILF